MFAEKGVEQMCQQWGEKLHIRWPRQEVLDESVSRAAVQEIDGEIIVIDTVAKENDGEIGVTDTTAKENDGNIKGTTTAVD